MLIEFEVKRETGDTYEDYRSGFIRTIYKARLTFTTEYSVRVRFIGEAYDIREAALMAVQGFLDGEVFETACFSDRNLFDVRPGIHWGPMSPMVKNIVENAIALKTGRGEKILPETNGLA
jgi:hypothetical protein